MPANPKRSLIVVAASAVVVLIAGGFWLATHPSLPPLQGEIDARVIDVSAKIPGRIAEVLVHEGDTVQAQTELVRIDIPELSAKVEQVKAKRTAALAKSSMAHEGTRTEQIAAAKAQYERAKAMATLARKSFSRVHALYAEGLVSAQKHDEAKANRDNALNAEKAAKQTYEMAKTGARTQEKEAADALAREAEQGLAEVESLAAESTVRAPRAGEVSRVVLSAGEVAPAGFPLVTLIDHTDKWVVFNVREDELSEITMGKVLQGEVPALAKTLAFRVYFISPRAQYATWRSTNQSTGYDVKTFEVRARPEQPLADLRPGMSVLVKR